MLKMILSYLLIFFSFIMISINNPISMGLMILLQTFFLSLLSGMMIYSYWFSYILFLTFMGGLLVLFIYVASIASNEIFMLSLFLKTFYLIIFPCIIFINIFFFNNLYMINNINMINTDMINFFNKYLFLNIENNINLSKLYNEQTYYLMMMMIIYLFITLLAVIKITNIFFGPLRSFN